MIGLIVMGICLLLIITIAGIGGAINAIEDGHPMLAVVCILGLFAIYGLAYAVIAEGLPLT